MTVRQLLFGLVWAAVFYYVACVLVGNAAGYRAAIQDPAGAPAGGQAAALAAIAALQPYLIAGALALAALGAWTSELPGTRRRGPLPPADLVGPRTERGWRLNRLLGGAAVGLILAFLTLVAVLHLLRTDYDPRHRYLSEYAIGPHRAVMLAAMASAGAALLTLALGLTRSVARSSAGVAAAVFLALAGVGFCLSAVWTTDAQPEAGAPKVVTSEGTAHDAAATFGRLFVLAAVLLAPFAFWRCPRWRPFVWPAAAGAALAIAIAIAGGLWLPHMGGLAQRLTYVALAAWALAVASHLRGMGIVPASPGSP
jgi:hypothetical protein